MNPYLVPDNYTNPQIRGTLTFTTDTGSTEAYATNALSIQYDTRADLSSLSKSAYQTYYSWPSSWNTTFATTKPASPDDYFYVVWYVRADAGTNDTQPFKFYLQEAPLNEGEVIGISSYSSSGLQAASTADFNTRYGTPPTGYVTDVANPRTTPTSNATYWDRYIYVRYPKSALTQSTPGVYSGTVQNQITATVQGVDSAPSTLTRTAPVDVAFNTNAPARPTDGISTTSSVKYNSGTSYGMINRLETGTKQPWKLVSTYAVPRGNYYFAGSFQGGALTQDADGNFGVRTYTATIEDSKLYYLNGSTPVYFTGLDYQYNKLYFTGYTEYDLTPTPTNPWATTARAATAHSPVELWVKVFDPATGLETWRQLGTIEKGLVSGQVRYRFTPLGGTPGAWLTALDIALPARTTGTRLVYTGNAYTMSFANTYLETELLVNTGGKVLAAIAGKNGLYVYNAADFTMSGADPAGNPVTYGPLTRAASHYITRVTTTSSISKGRSEPVNVSADGRYYVDYTTTGYEYITHPETDRQAVIDDQLLIEQRKVTFYDLLPPGTYADLGSITVTGYANNLAFATRVEVRDNWKNTGRTMLIVHAQVPEGLQNYYFTSAGTYSMLYSGMVLRFRAYNPWENVFDNGSTLTNYVAYEVEDGVIASGYPDNAGSTVIPTTLKAAFTDLNGDGRTGVGTPSSFLYASVQLTYTPLMSAQLGFEKTVASPEDPEYGESTQVPLAGEYTYRLRMANSTTNYAKDVVMYDILETSFGANPYWQGTLVGVDLSNATRKGINAKLYYTTQQLTEADLFADANHLSNNPGMWVLAGAGSDLSQAKAIAIDLRKLITPSTADKEFIPGESVSVYVKMAAPTDVTDAVIAEQLKAYNAAFLSNRKASTDRVYDTSLSIERSNITTVTLREPGILLAKGSVPTAGTEWLPTPVSTGETIEYTISITNTNLAQAIDRLQIQDVIPAGLAVNASGIRIMFDDNRTNAVAFPNSRAALTISGQQIHLMLYSLAGQEKATLIIPVTVQTVPVDVRTRDYVNKAQITSIYDRPFLLDSNITYHQLVMAKVTFQGTKTLLGRDWQGTDEFRFVLSDGWGIPLETVTSQLLEGAQYGFVFTPIAYYQPGVYDYTITEVPGSIDSVVYDPKTIQVRVTVTADVSGMLSAFTAYSIAGVPVAENQVGFINEYLTTQHTMQKVWAGDGPRPYPALTIYLYRDGVRYSTLLLPPGQTEYTWSDLPALKADGSGERSVYTHREVKVPANYQLTIRADGTLVNTYRPGTFTASKAWNGGIGPSATFILYQTVLNDTSATPYRMPLGSVVLDGIPQADINTSGEHTPWTYTWLNLPANGVIYTAADPDGLEVNFEYQVAEPQVPAGYAIDTSTSTSTLVINVAQTTTRTAEKTWEGTMDTNQPVRFQLYQAGLPYLDPVELAPGEREVTWRDLPRFRVWDPADRTKWVEYIYTFEELPLSGYAASYDEAGWQLTNTRLAAVGDLVWFDSDRNGLQDPGEQGVPGVRVTIAGANLPADYERIQITDASGRYLFKNLPAGAYTIRFEDLPAGFLATLKNAPGSTPFNDSDGLEATVVIFTEDDLSIDLGLVEAELPQQYRSISVPLQGLKELTGRQLREGEFEFILRDGAGKAIQTVTHDAEGLFSFNDRLFSRTGTFVYTVEERLTEEPLIVFDASKYRIIIKVYETGNELTSTVSIERNGTPISSGIRFHNQAKSPPTGDHALRLPLQLLLLSLALGGISLLLKRRARP